MVFYECEKVLDDGSCDPGGHFVTIYGRSQEKPTAEQEVLLRGILRNVCLELGDFDPIQTNGKVF
jgi:hypothetical protein